MQANKMFFDTFWPHNDNGQGKVIIILRDAKIYTEVARDEMFQKEMTQGCFIQNYSFETVKKAQQAAKQMIKTIKAKKVSVDDFITIEEERAKQRVFKAFKVIENMFKGV